MNIENLSVCEIGTLYLLQKNAKKGLLETTSRMLPELLKVSRETACKLTRCLETAGFIKTERTFGGQGKIKIFIGNGLNFRPLEKINGLNSRPLKNAPAKAVCIGAAGRNSYENLNTKNDSALKKSSSFPLNNPPINYNLTNHNKIKTTNNICAPTRNEENLLFKQEKPSFPYFESAGVLKEIVVDFFNYRKKDLKKPIKTQRGLDRLINRLKNLAGANVYLAKMICEQSKDHEWQDVFELKKETAERFMEKAKKEEIARTEEKRKKFIDSLFGGRK